MCGRGFKAVSETIAVLILIGITVLAGYVIYRAYTMQLRRQQAGVIAAEQLARERIGEKIALVDGYINTSNNHVVLILYNFGDVDVKIVKIIVPGITSNGQYKIFTFNKEYDLKRHQILRIDLTIDDPTITYPPGVTVKVNVWTSIGRIYSFDIKTVG
jgi:archaellum component FlaF (FlaF/FlaG flagellin family)